MSSVDLEKCPQPIKRKGNKVKQHCDVVIDSCLPFMNLLDDC